MKKQIVSKIASKTGYSETHVTNVLAGRRNNEEISKLYSKLTSKIVKKTKTKKISRIEAIAKIASKTGYSKSHITNVIAGRRNNKEISKLYSKLK